MRTAVLILLIAAAVVIFGTRAVAAKPFVIAVENKDWDPFYQWRNGKVSGACIDLARVILKNVGYEARFIPRPWSRGLHEVKAKKVDAGLCGNLNEDRSKWAHFPEEPMFVYDVTLFSTPSSSLLKSRLKDLKGKIFGVLRGYSFAGAEKILAENGASVHPFNSRKAIILNMVKGRIDGAMDGRYPFLPVAKKMGYEGKVVAFRQLNQASAYLFLSQKPGYKRLAKSLSTMLRRIKSASAFRELLDQYGTP